MSIYFISGTNGAGKTTLISNLSKLLDYTEVHDFDEIGVPKNVDEAWRIKTTAYWLQQAKRYQTEGKSTVICGVTVPQEIRDSSAYDDSIDVHFGYLHIEEADIRKRLGARNWNQVMINDNIQWAKQLESCVKAESGHYIVDGSNNTPEKVAKYFAHWIQSTV